MLSDRFTRDGAFIASIPVKEIKVAVSDWSGVSLEECPVGIG